MTSSTYPCPGCQTPLELSKDNAYRPFCSMACKTNDLLHWANEQYTIPDKPHSEFDH